MALKTSHRRSTVRLGVAAAVVMLGVLSGCGTAGSKAGANAATATTCDLPKQDAVTVNVLAYNSSAIDPFTNTMVASCSKNGVTVQHAPTDFSGQYQKTATTLAGGQGTFDIIEAYSGEVPRYGSTGKFLALDALYAKYKDQYKLGELNPAMLTGLSYNGKLYALPTQANVGTLVYRKDIFDALKLKPPKTYADLKSVAAAIQQSKKMQYPLALPLNDSTSTLYEQTLASQGVSYLDPTTTKPTFSSPQAAKGLQALRDLVPYMDPQVTSFKQPGVQQQLYNGKAAIAIMYSGRMADLTNPKNTTYAADFGFAPVPAVDAGGKSGASVSVDGWAIPTNSKINPDLLFQIMAASVSAEASKLAIPAAYPAREGIATAVTVPYAAAVQSALANGAATPPMQTWLGSMQNATSPLLQTALTGKDSVSGALAKAQTAGAAALTGN